MGVTILLNQVVHNFLSIFVVLFSQYLFPLIFFILGQKRNSYYEQIISQVSAMQCASKIIRNLLSHDVQYYINIFKNLDLSYVPPKNVIAPII